MAQTVDQFVEATLGRYIDLDGFPAYNVFQCVDLSNLYQRDVVGGGHVPAEGAKDWWDNYSTNDYVKVAMNERFVKGDVAVFAGELPGSGGYGHISIVLKELPNGQFESLDQNWPAGAPVSKVVHDRKHLLGFLRPRRLAKKEVLMDEEDAKEFYRLGHHREPENEQVWRGLVGKKFSTVAASARTTNDSEWQRQNHATRDYARMVLDLKKANNEIVQLKAQLAWSGGTSDPAVVEKAKNWDGFVGILEKAK